MQSSLSQQQPSQKRVNLVDSGVGLSSGESNMDSHQSTHSDIRTSSGSGRSTASRRQNPGQQLHQIEKSVTHLLVATKLLLETLTQWSRGTATEGEVSDVYVRLGYEFNIACRAFNAIGVDTGDLGPVPDLLRGILEDTLSQEASQASLDRFLPRIRDIIINLLQGLKKKQAKLRARAARDTERTSGSSAPTRQDSIDVLGDTPIPESQLPSRQTSGLSRQSGQRATSRDLHTGPELSERTSSRNEGRTSPNYGNDRYDSQSTLQSSNSTMSSTTAQDIPIIAPYPAEDTIPSGPQPPPHGGAAHNFPHPPPPPPKQDALLALQRGGDLERRASRRFSTYQIKQQLGGAANGIPMIPTQNSPVPNRGREVRESIQAVRQRGSTQYNRTKTERRLIGETSPTRTVPSRISEESSRSASQAPEVVEPQSPNIKTPEDKLGPSYFEKDGTERPRMSAVLAGPIDEPTFVGEPGLSAPSTVPQRRISRRAQTATPPPQIETSLNNEDSPQAGKPLTLFLQYKSKVKKIILDDGYNDLSVGRIQLAFIDKFAWNTHSEGIDLPEIYIQDNLSGVRYELEDLSDIKNNTVLVLNVEPLDEVKRHIDDGLSTLRRVVEGIKTSIDDQQGAIQLVSERQTESAKELASILVAPTHSVSSTPSTSGKRGPTPSASNISGLDQLSEIQTLRRDLAIMRQTYSSFTSDVEASMAAVRTKAASVKSVALKVALPSISGESGRAYVKKGLYDTLHKDQTAAFERVDEIQDSIEDLRKDVVTRGVRPLPRQLEQVAKDLANAATEVKRLEGFLTKEKPMWVKVWKQELQQVCDDKAAVQESEMLVTDLTADLEDAESTFRLVEEACKQQNLEPADGKGPRNVSGGRMVTLNSIDQSLDPRKAKDGVLGEVKGLQVDHESRLEAIARAERNRQKELESRKEGEFTKEVASFVEEGKLKKTGGVEEAERLRKARDDRARREYYERQNGIMPSAPPPPAVAEESRTNDDEAPSTSTEEVPEVAVEPPEPPAKD
ncbi:AIP3-domain-containing protein [Venturia nashicola]|uniref:AIP3-domain-containing protein n=1 Tax=Venturia nashicola TaxID=86259 RepID=A0A4Z1P5T7_9PEZI|nr:AIP3-domain-containing protein [Venturia nashicola]TLD22637.1 AIP3-domain-containing protein [Venturia nashicola]